MNLKQYMELNTLSASKIAEDSGVAVSTITRYLRGDIETMTAPVAAAISAATGGAVTITDLLYPNGIPDRARVA